MFCPSLFALQETFEVQQELVVPNQTEQVELSPWVCRIADDLPIQMQLYHGVECASVVRGKVEHLTCGD